MGEQRGGGTASASAPAKLCDMKSTSGSESQKPGGETQRLGLVRGGPAGSAGFGFRAWHFRGPELSRPRFAHLLLRLAVASAFNVAAIFLASLLIEGIDYGDDYWILILVGLVFTLVNRIVKPVTILLVFPAVILTLGVALFFINVLMLYVTSWIVPHFTIESFGAAALGALVIWAVNVALTGLTGRATRAVRARTGHVSARG